MSVHEQFAEDLSLYALGALRGEERLAVEEHLKECLACRQELEKSHAGLALLAFSAGGPRPPARSRTDSWLQSERKRAVCSFVGEPVDPGGMR